MSYQYEIIILKSTFTRIDEWGKMDLRLKIS